MAAGELRRFADRLGAAALLDEQSRAYRDAGLAYMRLEDADVFERLLTDQRLLRLPLVRCEQQLAVGADEQAWRGWVAEARSDQ
jgi:arsenate reductase-like glutaredoxin family protein